MTVLRVFAPQTADIANYGTHYGLPLGAWGEDGDLFALGHAPARLALAAATRARRTVEGIRLRPFPRDLQLIWHQWARFVRLDESPDEWECTDGQPYPFPGAVAVTVISGQDGIAEFTATATRCPLCTRMSTSSDARGIEHRRCTRCGHRWTHPAGRSRYIRPQVDS